MPSDYAVSQLPNSNDLHLLALCGQLLSEPPEVNRVFAAAVDNQIKRQGRDRLAEFIYRSAMLAVRQRSPKCLQCGFVALAFGVASDIELLHQYMAVLNRSAEHLKLNAHQLFEMAIERTADPYLARIMAAFDSGSATYKSLRTFQLR